MQLVAAQKLKRSKSKNKGKDIDELEWHYESCVLVTPYSFNDLVAGKGANHYSLTLEEKIVDEVGRTQTSLVCSMKGATAYHEVQNPVEVEQTVRKRLEMNENEQARIDAMTPEQRDAETAQLIALLSGLNWPR
jgi:hypothetical protein